MSDPIEEYYQGKPRWFKEMIRRHTHIDLHSDKPDMIVYTEPDLLEIVKIAQKEKEDEIKKQLKFIKHEQRIFIFIIVVMLLFIFAFYKVFSYA